VITIPARFNGPPGSANGGYSCGLIASLLEGDAEVTLRSPPPLETPMAVTTDGDRVLIHDGDVLVAEARPVEIDLEIPTAPSLKQAEAARERYLGYERHEFPTCFTCGTERNDGLSVRPGPVMGTGVVASTWTADESLPSEGGHLRPEIVWAALDCPGAWATMREVTSDAVVLGRMAARIVAPVLVGSTVVSYGWQMGVEGRKAYAGTAVADERGQVMGYARQTGVALR
jgi:hypothetical protein